MPLKFNVVFEDPSSSYANYYALLTSNILAAGQLWAEYIVSEAEIEIKVSFEEQEAGTASGGPSTSKYIRTYEGVNIYQIGTVDEILTGVDTNGGSVSDAAIIIDPFYLQNELWFNPSPSIRGAVPLGKTDAISVFMHEIGHGFGFSGWADRTTGQLPGYGSVYDSYISIIGGIPYFNGTNAVSVYGGPVPLTLGNLMHYGNKAPNPGSELTVAGLMNGVVYYRGSRYDIGPLDIAFMKDIGLPINDFVGFRSNDTLVGDAFDNLFKGLWGNDTMVGGPGFDTAAYTGPSTSYVVTYNADTTAYTVKDTVAGRDGTDVLTSIEYLQFADITQSAAYFVQPGLPSYTLTAGATAVNEGGANIYTLTTTNVAAGTVLKYSLSGSISAADIVGGALTGSLTVAASGSTQFTVALVADRLNEGTETMVVTVGSASVAALATAAAVIVNDTSVIAVAGNSAESAAARVFQALYGQAPGNAIYNSAIAKIGPSGNGFDWANSEVQAFSQLSNSAFSTLVLNNISITPTSLLPTVTFGNAQQVYGALQLELTNYLALVGMGNRGTVAVQLTQILASYEGETLYGVYGPAASAFVKQVTANINYSINPANMKSMPVAVPTAVVSAMTPMSRDAPGGDMLYVMGLADYDNNGSGEGPTAVGDSPAGDWVDAALIGQSSAQHGGLSGWSLG